MRVMRSLLLAVLAGITSSLVAQSEPALPWPPEGPVWETVPARALERARNEKKAVMAYVATAGCPHCVVMARETWPTDDVKRCAEDVVFLAVHRNDDVDWTTRLNVIAYPQTLFLDGAGNVLPGGRDHAFARTKEQVVAAVRAFAGERETVLRPLRVPQELLRGGMPKQRIQQLGSPDCDVRLAAWRQMLPGLTPAQLQVLFVHEPDAMARLEALRAMPRTSAHHAAATELATKAAGDPNDYVRQEAVAAMIDAVLAGESGYANPNNMLCAATKAAATVAEPALVEPLASVLRKEKANNSATHLAVAALAAIGERHGKPAVEKALELALAVDGAGAERLHVAARAALGR
jgi:hypothetical protein